MGMDIIIIGYNDGNGVRRWGIVTPMIHGVGNEGSALSSTCNGLRRKPIPLLLLTGLACLSVLFSLSCFLLMLSSLLIFIAELFDCKPTLFSHQQNSYFAKFLPFQMLENIPNSFRKDFYFYSYYQINTFFSFFMHAIKD